MFKRIVITLVTLFSLAAMAPAALAANTRSC